MSEPTTIATTAAATNRNYRTGARVIIAGGGTGGHIFPAVAVANALKKLDPTVELLFVGANGKMEMEKVPQAGFQIRGLDITGFDRGSLIKNFSLPYKLIRSFFQVRNIFKAFKPTAVFGVGGYSSYPVLRFAQLRNIPTFLHESNAFAGKSNQMLGQRAKRIFVATEGMSNFFPEDKIVITGNPVRDTIKQAVVLPSEARTRFGLEPDSFTLFVMGGSLGAKSINESIAAGLDRLLKSGIQLVWQTGKLYAEKAKEVVEGRKGVWTGPFITQMEDAYAAANLIVSRAGAMSVAELCIVGKPALFVPFPFAAEDHQTANAKALADKNAALLISDKEVGKRLVDTVLELASNQEMQETLSNNIHKHAVLNADSSIAKLILENLE